MPFSILSIIIIQAAAKSLLVCLTFYRWALALQAKFPLMERATV